MENKFLTNLNAFRIKHEPEILMSIGLAGLTFSVVWGVKATIKAVKICDKKKEETGRDKLTKKEIFKLTWKTYLPVAISTGLSIPCIIAGNRVSSRRNAALVAAYTISENALREYQSKTKELVGEEKEKEIRDTIAQDKLNETKEIKEIVLADDSEQLFYEPLSGRYFKGTWNKLSEIVNDLNARALSSVTGYYTLNDFYEAIGLDSIDLGEEIGWGTPGLVPGCGLLKIQMSTAKTKDNKACGCIDYVYRPYPIR